MKLQLSICSISLFLCQFTVQPLKPLTVPEFNRKVHEFFVEQDTSVRSYSVEGYYTDRRGTILVSDVALLSGNAILPDSLYIPLYGKGIDSIERSKEVDRPKIGGSPYELSFVRVQIYAKVPYRGSGPDSLLTKTNLQLNVEQRPTIIRGRDVVVDHVTDLVQLLDASSQQSGNGIKSAGMVREYFFKILIRTGGKIEFDSVWVNHRCFKTYVANNRRVISNDPVEYGINDTITVIASAIGPYANRECLSPMPYEGDALLRVLVDDKPYFIIIKKLRGITIYNRL